MTTPHPIQLARRLGQSIWCDFLSRDLLTSGGLDAMIRSGVRGVTTNPSIFDNAIGKTSDYDDDILDLRKKGRVLRKFTRPLPWLTYRRPRTAFSPSMKRAAKRTALSAWR